MYVREFAQGVVASDGRVTQDFLAWLKTVAQDVGVVYWVLGCIKHQEAMDGIELDAYFDADMKPKTAQTLNTTDIIAQDTLYRCNADR